MNDRRAQHGASTEPLEAAAASGAVTVAGGKATAITILCLCEVAAMALWFSASAVLPALVAAHGLDGFAQSLLTSSVQAGFVVGSLASAVLGLADRVDPRRLFMAAAIAGAAANLAILAVPPASPMVVVLRFATGVCMAGVYPVGMKMAASWASRDLGLLVGILVGALTLGSALPHLFNAFGGLNWRFTLIAASASALFGGLAIGFVGLGPNRHPAPPFEPAYILKALRSRSIRLANLGYLGHMWELYAMWAWIGVFLQASFAVSHPQQDMASAAKLAAFATIGVGALGCLAGGLAADRIGRTTMTILALAVSGTCAATVGFLFGGPPGLLIAVCLVWGFAIIADSAQFSAAVAELSAPSHTGTMLTFQTAAGFLLTLVTIHLMPHAVESFGWSYAFMPLAIGPVIGIVAMARLRASPDSAALAGGRR